MNEYYRIKAEMEEVINGDEEDEDGEADQVWERNNHPVQRGRGYCTHPDLQRQTEEQTGGILREVPRPLQTRKILRPRRCDLYAGQIPIIHPFTAAVQRGTQKESENARKNGIHNQVVM